jgi:hypothetical protein
MTVEVTAAISLVKDASAAWSAATSLFKFETLVIIARSVEVTTLTKAERAAASVEISV